MEPEFTDLEAAELLDRLAKYQQVYGPRGSGDGPAAVDLNVRDLMIDLAAGQEGWRISARAEAVMGDLGA